MNDLPGFSSQQHGWPRSAVLACGVGLVALLVGAAYALSRFAPAEPGAAWTSTTLFDDSRVWSVRLTFTPEEWATLQSSADSGPFGRGAGPGGPPGGFPDGRGTVAGGAGPGGAHGNPDETSPGQSAQPNPAFAPGAGGFGSADFITQALLSQGDRNRDGRLSRRESVTLGETWFRAWDTPESGRLDQAKVQAGLNTLLTQPGGMGGLGLPGFGGRGGRGQRAGALGRGAPGAQSGQIEGDRSGERRGPGAPAGPGGRGGRGGPGGRGGMDSGLPSVRADLRFEDQQLPDVAVRLKGNNTLMSSAGSLKRPLKVDINDNAPGRKLGGANEFNLNNSVNDASWMNEVLSYRLFRDAGVPASRTAYAKVYVTVPGQYDNHFVGLYVCVETVDSAFARDRFGTKKGALFKPVTGQIFEDWGDTWDSYQRTYDPKTPVPDEETQRVIAFCKLVSHAGDAEFAARLEEFLDLDEFARFMAVTTFLSARDSILSMGQNYFVYLHPKTRQFQFIPWDLDHSFGQFGMGSENGSWEDLSILHPYDRGLFLDRVFGLDRFKQLYLARMKEFSETIFKPERFYAEVDALAPILRPAVAEESAAMLARFDRAVAGESAQPAGSGEGPPGFPPEGAGGRFGFPGPPGGFRGGPKPIKGFVTARAQSVGDQLAGKSAGRTSSSGGFGPPGGRGGFGGPPGGDLPGRGGAPGGGPGGFGGPPGIGRSGGRGGRGPMEAVTLFGQLIVTALDTDSTGDLTEAEILAGFGRSFDALDADHSGALTEDQLRRGIDRGLTQILGGEPR